MSFEVFSRSKSYKPIVEPPVVTFTIDGKLIFNQPMASLFAFDYNVAQLSFDRESRIVIISSKPGQQFKEDYEFDHVLELYSSSKKRPMGIYPDTDDDAWQNMLHFFSFLGVEFGTKKKLSYLAELFVVEPIRMVRFKI